VGDLAQHLEVAKIQRPRRRAARLLTGSGGRRSEQVGYFGLAHAQSSSAAYATPVAVTQTRWSTTVTVAQIGLAAIFLIRCVLPVSDGRNLTIADGAVSNASHWSAPGFDSVRLATAVSAAYEGVSNLACADALTVGESGARPERCGDVSLLAWAAPPSIMRGNRTTRCPTGW
jgi:hypothetical protein